MTQVYFSSSLNPYTNLGIEQWILEQTAPEYPKLFIWRNNPSIICGRFQNPWREIWWRRLQEDNVDFVRRRSGGGTVYHDPGNLCFSFFHPGRPSPKEENLKLLIEAIKPLGVELMTNERNDLIVEHEGVLKKVSGSAFKEKKDRSLHHCTLLVNTNLDRLSTYLHPHKGQAEIKGPGISSVRSKVANINQIRPGLKHEAVTLSVVQFFQNLHQCSEAPLILGDDHLASRHFSETLVDPLWRIDETPRFDLLVHNNNLCRFQKGRLSKVEGPESEELNEFIGLRITDILSLKKDNEVTLALKLSLLGPREI